MNSMSHRSSDAVLRAFSLICSVPHGSGFTKKISDTCVEFARSRGYECRQDEANNVVIVKPASEGYEDAPSVMLQAHLDMVCEKIPGLDFDFTKDSIRLVFDGDILHADGTTLGADDGIGAAMALAILDDRSLLHPRLEIILTSDEEVGLDGARDLDMSDLKARKLINLDSEEEGFMTVSCAGGARVHALLPIKRQTVRSCAVNVTISGLLGGHSGVDIDKGHANANILMGRLLNALRGTVGFKLISLQGGTNDNVIPGSSCSCIAVDRQELEKAEAIIREQAAVYASEYQTADPGICVETEIIDEAEMQAVSDCGCGKIIDMLLLAPQGIQAMSMDIPGLVQTSLNMGILRLREDNAEFVFAVRSSLAAQKNLMIDQLASLMRLLGGDVSVHSEYPAWEFKKQSDLREMMARVYHELTGKEIRITATHGGLECGLFCGKQPDLDCVSIGPELHDVHTVNERVSLSSVDRTWEYLLAVLRECR